MKLLRKAHLLLGCFFAPPLLFFISTGWYQTMHPGGPRKSAGGAVDLMDRLRLVHTTSLLPSASAAGYRPFPFQVFVAVMAAALIVTVILGVVLAARIGRPKWLVWACLALGAMVPLVLLLLGQQHPG
jgi:hypothetical protein